MQTFTTNYNGKHEGIVCFWCPKRQQIRIYVDVNLRNKLPSYSKHWSVKLLLRKLRNSIDKNFHQIRSQIRTLSVLLDFVGALPEKNLDTSTKIPKMFELSVLLHIWGQLLTHIQMKFSLKLCYQCLSSQYTRMNFDVFVIITELNESVLPFVSSLEKSLNESTTSRL